MLLFIDNFDSFTYNLVQLLEQLGASIRVIRNNTLTIQQCLALHPSHIVIGPGPGNPSSAGLSKSIITAATGQIPILGVCLGHQAIAEAYGGHVVRASYPMHGKTSAIFHDHSALFTGLSQGFLATRYHSLIVHSPSLPPCLKITGWTEKGEIMALSHQNYPIYGVQFHPESILTEGGATIFRNFLDNPFCQR